jgi:cell wall assembly regulator SMI1
MVGNWRLMSIQEIQAAWGWLTALAAKGAFDERHPLPSPYLHHTWWHPAWVPIASSDTGDYICLDTDPPEAQRTGQLLLFLQDQAERYLVAANLTAWLAQIKEDLDAGLYIYDEENGFNCEALMWSALEGKHHFDQIPGKIIAEENLDNEDTP